MAHTSRADKKTAKGSGDGKTTPVVLDFLGETMLVSQTTGRVSLRAISDRLNVSAPAVSRMAQRMVRKGFVHREGACGLVLTETGEELALRSIRKRRIYEVFLVERLGYGWHEVYPLAAASSNHIDDDVIERMYEQLGQPKRCPHGDIIPNKRDPLQQSANRALSSLPDGTVVTISRVASHDTAMLSYLNQLGLRPGATIELVSRAPFSGPLRIRVASGAFQDEHVIGSQLADTLMVE